MVPLGQKAGSRASVNGDDQPTAGVGHEADGLFKGPHFTAVQHPWSYLVHANDGVRLNPSSHAVKTASANISD